MRLVYLRAGDGGFPRKNILDGRPFLQKKYGSRPSLSIGRMQSVWLILLKLKSQSYWCQVRALSYWQAFSSSRGLPL